MHLLRGSNLHNLYLYIILFVFIYFCSPAFYPGPVGNFDVYNITAQTANISWTLPQSQGFSDVTYFLITLEDHGLIDNVTRGNGDYQYMLNNLKPYKNYAVSIGAGNVYGFGDVILKTFITNCAGRRQLFFDFFLDKELFLKDFRTTRRH